MCLITQTMMYMSACRPGAFESPHVCVVYMCVNGRVGVRERSPWRPSAKREVFLTSFNIAFASNYDGVNFKDFSLSAQ